MRRFLGTLAGAAILSMPITVGADRDLKLEFHVYDIETLDYIRGADVLVQYADGSQSGLTGNGPGQSALRQGSILFRLPGVYPWVHVTVTADGYCDFEEDIYLGSKPHVGGRGIWIPMEPCPVK